MKRNVYFIIFSVTLIVIGRHLTFIPTFGASEKGGETSEIKEDIKKIISKQKGSYSVYYIDLKTGENFGIDEKQVHTASSLNKPHVVAALYYLAQKGEADLDQQITIQETDIQDYGTGRIRYGGKGQTYTLKTLAKLAIKDSDNTAVYVLANKIGRSEIQKIIESWGLKQTDIEQNKTSAYDVYLLFKKIYFGELAKPSYSQELLGFFKDTDTEDRLPYLLPKNAEVFHKTGDGVGDIHDAGIVKNGEEAYYIGVLASDVGDQEKETKGAIAKISKDVYDFHKNR